MQNAQPIVQCLTNCNVYAIPLPVDWYPAVVLWYGQSAVPTRGPVGGHGCDQFCEVEPLSFSASRWRAAAGADAHIASTKPNEQDMVMLTRSLAPWSQARSRPKNNMVRQVYDL
jgi:hypothetical protein